MSVVVPDGVAGRRILSFAWWTTGAFALTAVLAAIWPNLFLRVLAIIVALGAFAIGMVVFLGAYFRAIGRSRYEEISVVGVYLLMGGVAPRAVRRSLLGALAAQIVVALSTASARPYSSLAFGVLVPLLGVALCGWWSSVHGTFPPRRQRDAAADEDKDDEAEDDDADDEDGADVTVDDEPAESAGE